MKSNWIDKEDEVYTISDFVMITEDDVEDESSRPLKRPRLEHSSQKLADLHPHPRDARIQFDELNHKYTIDGVELKGSVTSWLNNFFPSFNTEAAIKQTFNPKAIVVHPDGIIRIRADHSNKKNAGKSREEVLARYRGSAPFGSYVHNVLEKYCELLGVKDPLEFAVHEKLEIAYTLSPNEPEPVPEQYRECIRQGIDFIDEMAASGFRCFRVEQCLFCDELKLAGKFDLMMQKTNESTGQLELALFDWKVTDKNFEKPSGFNNYTKHAYYPIDEEINCPLTVYSMQLNLYKYIAEKHYGYNIVKMGLVQLNSNSSSATYQYHHVYNKQNEIKQMIAVWQNSNNYISAINEWESQGAVDESPWHPTYPLPAFNEA